MQSLRRRGGSASAILALLVLAAAPLPARPAAPPQQPVDADAAPAGPKTVGTPSGAAFTAPAGWSTSSVADGLILTPPEADLHVAVVDVGQAADARAAAAEGWRLYAGGTKRALRLATPAAPANGWEERVSLEYETSPDERAVARAIALRKGRAWTVSILDGASATLEKRGAAIQLVVQSLRAPGYRRESFAGRTARPLDAARIEALKAFVSDAMAALDIPGAGLALVDHGRVVFEGGLGVREFGRSAPVDAHTRFMIASNTKGMTTLLLARLVDQGRLRWDEPVTAAYPGFRLGSAATTGKVQLRHLVCACTGLPRKDMESALNTRRDTPATSVFDRLAGTEPTSGFGEAYQYNNLMAAAAGYVGAHAAFPNMEVGAAYDRAMGEMIFGPLGMRETTFDEGGARAADHATPHNQDVDGRIQTVDLAIMGSIYPSRPAGGAWSSAHDVMRYVQDELATGVAPGGARVVSAENLLMRRRPNVPVGEDVDYGMGLIIDRSSGVTVIHHGGSLPGFMSDLYLLPQAQVGAVLLTNSDTGALLLRPFMRRLLEVLYDGAPQAAADVAAAAAAHRAAVAKDRESLVFPAADEASARLAAAYVSPDLGRIVVSREGGLTFDFGQWRSRMATRRNGDGTLSFVTTQGLTGLQFVMAGREGSRDLVLRDGQHEYRYASSQ